VYQDLVCNKNHIHNFSVETSCSNFTLEQPSMPKKLVNSFCEFLRRYYVCVCVCVCVCVRARARVCVCVCFVKNKYWQNCKTLT